MFENFHMASALIGACAALVVVLCIVPWHQLTGKAAALNSPDFSIDPWAIQKQLMTISSQNQPVSPEINKASLMYAALIMEEAAETYEALYDAVRWSNAIETVGPLRYIAECLQRAAAFNSDAALLLRGHLEDCEEFRVGLSRDRAIEIFDGTTDVAVVNCGFAQASGFPGAAGYAEVGISNLSKQNPDTGVIDKTADGKWIKGRNYRKPDLGAVLDAHRAVYAVEVTA